MDTSNLPAPAEPVKPPQPAPVMDIVPPKVAEAPQSSQPSSVPKKTAPAASNKSQVIRPPKQPGSGIGLVVFATVVIVLGLGAMMVYAYLRTNGINFL